MSDHMRFRTGVLVERFDLQAKAGEVISEEYELDASIHRIQGVLLTSDREDLLFYRGSQQIDLSGRELIPEDYESKLLMSGLNVAPQLRFHETDLDVGNRKVDIKFKDTDHPKAPFVEYRVTLYLFCRGNDSEF